ncbi:Zn-dependent hydrolase [Haloplanus sp. GCM10025708]
MLGSAAWVGDTPVDEALAITDRDGVSVEEALEETGYDGDEPCEPHGVHAHVELHIEQGPKLESLGKSVGVVEGVYSMAWMEATVHGEADHAGPTPMHQRTDALTAATDAIDRVEAMPNDLSSDAVATVGRVSVDPDAINVIPSRAEFTVDVRSYDDAVVEEAVDRVQFELQTACDRVGAEHEFEKLWHIPHTEFDEGVVSVLDETASDLDIAHERMVSGAGHDAKYVSDVAPAAMVFVPSEDGKTHNEAEFTPWEDVVAGTRVYAEATRRLANES